jgi:hypothetical protein
MTVVLIQLRPLSPESAYLLTSSYTPVSSLQSARTDAGAGNILVLKIIQGLPLHTAWAPQWQGG